MNELTDLVGKRDSDSEAIRLEMSALEAEWEDLIGQLKRLGSRTSTRRDEDSQPVSSE